jgi:hypothetical protein
MYPDVSQMYLTCSVTFQENTCILTFSMRILNVSKTIPRYILGYTSDTSRYMYMYLGRFLGVKPPGETFPQFPQNRNRKSEKGVVRLRTIIAHCLATRASCVLVRVCRVLKAHSVHKLGASQRQRCGSNAVRHPPSISSPIKVYKLQDHQPHR